MPIGVIEFGNHSLILTEVLVTLVLDFSLTNFCLRLKPSWIRPRLTGIYSQLSSLPTWLLSHLSLLDFTSRKPSMSYVKARALPPTKIVFVICLEGHWSLVIHDVNTEHTRAFDGVPHRHDRFHRLLADVCASHFGHAPVFFPSDSLLLQREDAICGVIALINLGWQCGLWNEFSYSDALVWFDALDKPAVCCGAGMNDFGTAHTFLTNFLPSRGVPSEAAADRAAQAIKKLGLNPILKAISHENPWRQLKAIGSNASRPFQWVTSDELRDHIAARASTKFGADTQKKPKKRAAEAKVTQPMPLAAEGLRVPDGTFVNPEGKPLVFIPLDAMKADCTGITIASLEQTHRFLTDSRSLSTQALGMLTVQKIPDNHPGSLPIEHLTWPALFGDEPLLVRGSLIQLGDRHAALKPGPNVKTTQVSTSLMRLQVYRDQWNSDWPSFTKGPLKRLVQSFQPLQICHLGKGATSCSGDCGKYHPPVDEPTDLLIIDCFAWKWFNAEGKGVSPTQSDSFSIMIRIPTNAVTPILNLAGRDGFYPELREAKDAPAIYAVIWVKGALADAQYHLQTQPHALHLTRLFMKYGLRCLKKHEESLRKALFPDEPFVSCAVTLLFQVGPWSHGLSKQAVQEAVVAIPWTAKVLKPCKGNSEGRFWIVGAPQHPTVNVFQHGDAWLTISLLRDAQVDRPVNTVVASLKTIQKIHESHHSPGPVDPWMHKDPWSSWRPSTASASTAAPPAARIDDIEERIKSCVQSEIQTQAQLHQSHSMDEDMEPDPWKAQMESNIAELREQSQRYTEWFHEAGAKINNLQENLQQQGQTIEALDRTVQQQGQVASTLQQQMSQLDAGIKQELRDANQLQADRIQEQTERLEALFSKRTRHEWLFVPSRLRVGTWSIWWLWIYVLCLVGRLGEASNPGPFSCSGPTMDFNLGTLNASGLAHKASHVGNLPPGLWGAAETQLTSHTARGFKRDLQFHTRPQNRRVRVLHGEYAPLRRNSSTCGSWTGVAFVSDISPRAVQLPWSIQYTSGRALCAHFSFGNLAMTGAVVYLPPSGPTYGSTKSLADEFLGPLTEELVFGAKGLRFICGDWNRGPNDLHTFQLWRQAGWEEVQILALKRFHRPLTPTSKNTAFSDQIWVSPELAAHLTTVTKLEEIFSEHDPLMATFSLPSGPMFQWHWPTPATIPWDEAPADLQWDIPFDPTLFWQNSTKAFASWSASVETALEHSFSTHQIALPRGFKGRGQTTQTVKRPLQLAPLHPSRHGDEVIVSDMLNRSVHHWFKQLRRLQAYSQRASSTSMHPALQVDLMYTWKGITRAAGFRGGFLQWWPTRSIQLHGSPQTLPLIPPDQNTAWIIFVDFRANFRRYEQWQLSRRQSLLQAQAHDHGRVLYQQLKSTDFSPPEWFTLYFDTMIGTTGADSEVDLVDELTLPVEAEWTLQGQSVVLEHLGGSRVRISTDLILAPGQLLCGRLRVHDFVTMESALDQVWHPIWNRHLDAPQDQWQRAFAFASAHLPRGLFEAPMWTGERVGHLLAQYKKRTATGPDGWSRLDLASLPAAQHDQIAQLFGLLQHGLEWPTQITTGFVCPVRKIVEAERPSDYRPIILLSMLYRAWAAGASRCIVPCFSQLAGPHIYGFIPGQRATDLWFLVQAAVESAIQDQCTFGGFNLDLIKCFNRLPRAPLFHGLRCLGLPNSICSTWERALSSLQRRFRIGTDTGPPRSSVTGYPEGDPLSCCAMISFNIIMDKYMLLYSGQTLLTSFVDNISILSDSPATLQQGVLIAQVFLQMFDLDLDLRKSYAWGTDPSFRKMMRTFGYRVKLAERDLGAQMTFSKVSWSQSGVARLQSISHFWSVLRKSPVHSWFKLRALCSAGWPKALHGCENRLMPPGALAKLRSQAMAALGWRRAGASPLIRWSLQQQPEVDPEFYQMWTTMRTFLRMLNSYPHLQVAWRSFVQQPPTSGQGPFHSMWKLCAQLGWSWTIDLCLGIGFLVLGLHELHFDLLRMVLLHAWDRYVVSCLRSRRDYHDLASIDREISFKRADLAPSDQALLLTIQDGTFFTNWHIGKFDETRVSFCDICHTEDDLEHRCLQCPKYEAVRAQHLPCIRRWNQDKPSFHLHALAPENPWLCAWWQYLHSLPADLENFAWHLPAPAIVDVFTDGSCTDANTVYARAAWALVYPDQHVILASAPLFGIQQTINRAELCGVLAALHWKLKNPCHLRIWSDSLYVVQNFQNLLRTRQVPSHWRNQDLWHRALALTYLIDWDSCDILKVQAHGHLPSSTSPYEDWLIAGNALADQVAKRQNDHRSDEAETLLCQMQESQMQMTRQAHSQQNFLLAIAHFDLQREPRCTEVDPEDITLDRLGGPCLWNDCVVAGVLESCIEAGIGPLGPFRGGFLSDLSKWLFGVDMLGPYKQYVSLPEIIIGFELEHGTFPVWVPHEGVHVALYENGTQLGALVRPTLAGSVSLLKLALETLFDFACADLTLIKCERPHLGVVTPVWCLEIGWPFDLSTRVAVCFEKIAPLGIRHSRDMARSYHVH